MSAEHDLEAVAVVVGLVLLGMILAHDCEARAQYEPPPVDRVFPIPRPAEVFILSRIAYHETSGQSDADHIAIDAVIRNKGARYGVPYVTMARRYARRATCAGDCTGRNAPRGRRTAWIQQLFPGAYRPPLFPRSTPWASTRRTWLRVLRMSREILMGWHPAPCEPMDWGCESQGCNDTPGYLRNHPRACRVDCGETLNVFWRPGGDC